MPKAQKDPENQLKVDLIRDDKILENIMVNREFYIGWMPVAPDGLSRHIRKSLIALMILLLTAGILLALGQRKFSTASFEYGRFSEVKGIYQQLPVPSLKVISEEDATGKKALITIPLVGYGKFGAEGIIASLEKEINLQLDQREVIFKGVLIYSDGKSLLQIDKYDDPLVYYSAHTGSSHSAIRDLGVVQLNGEVLDPKCYFGVMKPGQGKPHRDCAIRCIEGGMSPVFYVRNEKGASDYYLLVGSDGRKLDKELRDIIAEPVTLKARAVQQDDWIILYLDKNGSIRPTGGWSWKKEREGTIGCGIRE